MTPIFVVDAFTNAPFRGNPAGVVLLEQDAEDEWMQAVAAEMRHAETAFVRQVADGYSLRWFTPTSEVDLCGHATLAAAKVLWLQATGDLKFYTKSGVLTARPEIDDIVLDFPAESPEPCGGEELLGFRSNWFGKNRMDYIAELDNEVEVRSFEPDFTAIAALGMRGLIITARSEGTADFVSRFFAPAVGVPEDPVTGSAHCCLAPFWAEKLGKTDLTGYQVSERGGRVRVRLTGDRVELIGQATLVLSGQLHC